MVAMPYLSPSEARAELAVYASPAVRVAIHTCPDGVIRAVGSSFCVCKED